jgi:hypothetical protein
MAAIFTPPDARGVWSAEIYYKLVNLLHGEVYYEP